MTSSNHATQTDTATAIAADAEKPTIELLQTTCRVDPSIHHSTWNYILLN